MLDATVHALCGECWHLHARIGMAMGFAMPMTGSANKILQTAPCEAEGCRLKPGKGFQPISARLLAIFESHLDLPAHACGVTRTRGQFDPSDPIDRQAVTDLLTGTVRRHAFSLPLEIAPAELIAALRCDLGLTG